MILAGDHHRLIHPIDPGQGRGHLAELDAIPTHLDLLIGTPHIPQLPVGTPAHQVSGAIHTCSWDSDRFRRSLDRYALSLTSSRAASLAERTRHKP
uniref:Uncharacterized protein n=1 Tax=Mycobacterium riyadhense TaxID=486698 RepID=A0A653F193_9MYCO|nr:hypothetical protein BIN_B_05110 [Mycobacterium riyadhense]